jgi:hypothetical protein
MFVVPQCKFQSFRNEAVDKTSIIARWFVRPRGQRQIAEVAVPRLGI